MEKDASEYLTQRLQDIGMITFSVHLTEALTGSSGHLGDQSKLETYLASK